MGAVGTGGGDLLPPFALEGIEQARRPGLVAGEGVMRQREGVPQRLQVSSPRPSLLAHNNYYRTRGAYGDYSDIELNDNK